MALYLAARGLVGEWQGSLIRHSSILETVSYSVHTRILLRELCVIQTTVLVNSGDRHVCCPRRSRFRPPINTTLLTSSRLHSPLHPPLARPLSLSLSLSNLCHGAAGLPMRRRGVTGPEDAHSNSSDKDPYAPPEEVVLDPPTLDWFWGQYNLCLWKSLPPAEKAR